MASKMRITVNFSYSGLHQMIMTEAKRTCRSSSAVIQDMLSDALTYRLDNNEFMPEGSRRGNKNLVPEKAFKKDFEINNLTIDGSVTGGMDSFYHQLHHGRFTVPLGLEIFCGVNKTYNAIDRKYILECVVSDLQETLNVLANKEFTPIIFLVFIGEVSIKYQDTEGDKMRLDINYFYKVIPVYRCSDDETLMLDLKNIKYREFHDIAIKGWDRRKYSHLLYVKGLKGKRSGGYFIGVLCEPQPVEELIMPSEGDFWGRLNNRYRFLKSLSTVKFVMYTFPHSVSMNTDGSFTVKEKISHDVGMIHRYTRGPGTSV
ncbi:hypothetical protein [Yersinia pseudotuberculosis]|uniref:hypothetical protein n=1 Tax=Yersinia pseudotuberculosis TaxID=633 RepID=UPI0005078240|nr:hypothetical protein [Yersinia pseudotuberculosis]KGA65896.1 hypothetical protein DJ55_3626 [Yersinia pseudotuberculosis]